MIRLLAYLWASPNSILGLLCAVGGRGWRLHRGVLEVTGGWFPKLLGSKVQAITLGHVILARNPELLACWLEHERRHVRQYESLGPLFLPAYFGLSLYAALRGRHPYRDNLLERQAGLQDRQGS